MDIWNYKTEPSYTASAVSNKAAYIQLANKFQAPKGQPPAFYPASVALRGPQSPDQPFSNYPAFSLTSENFRGDKRKRRSDIGMILKIVSALICALILVEGKWDHNRCYPGTYNYYESYCKVSTSDAKESTWYQDEAFCRILNGTLTIKLLNHDSIPRELYVERKEISRVETGFAKIPSLELLSLEDNNIEEIEGPVFGGLPRLVHLSLARNRIRHLSKDSFEGLNKLRTLNLNHNLIKNGISFSLAERILPSLTHLYLQHNQLESISLENGMSTLCNSTLTHLYLSSNSIREFKPSDINPCLTKLTHLYLEDNRLDSNLNVGQISLEALALDGNEIHDVPEVSSKIKYLSLARNFIKSPRFSENIKNHVVFLTLSYNTIINLSYENGFVDWPSLEYLALDHNYISSIPNGCFRNLSSLRSLDLAGNKIDSVSPKSFAVLPEWRELYLGDNKLSHFPGGEFVEKSMRLNYLDVSDNEVKSVADLEVNMIPMLEVLKLTGNPLKRIDVNLVPNNLVILL